MDPGLISHSYKNLAYPIESGQTISQPYTVAFQTELINCKRGRQGTRNWNWIRISDCNFILFRI